ncbi:MAG: hypothetical protein WEA77_08875 [Hyphomonas sp.]|uniref:hypothetical protein n=1 Tax=Hyphomonas sp. TaxID=87 RepID=UPI00349FD939
MAYGRQRLPSTSPKSLAMITSSRKEARQSLLSFLAAVPAAALVVWATLSLTHFVV